MLYYIWVILCVSIVALKGFSDDGFKPRSTWRWCYVCSGIYPDRECELYPKYVSKGPGFLNCTRNYCTVYVRYKPSKYLITYKADGSRSTSRPLVPKDYEVTSIARECEDNPRGNLCEKDGDMMGITCYTTCGTDFCNNVTRNPMWEDYNLSGPTVSPSSKSAGSEHQNAIDQNDEDPRQTPGFHNKDTFTDKRVDQRRTEAGVNPKIKFGDRNPNSKKENMDNSRGTLRRPSNDENHENVELKKKRKKPAHSRPLAAKASNTALHKAPIWSIVAPVILYASLQAV